MDRYVHEGKSDCMADIRDNSGALSFDGERIWYTNGGLALSGSTTDL